MNINKIFFKYGLYYPVTLLNGVDAKKYTIEMSKSQHFTEEKLNKIKLFKLNRLIRHSKKNVLFYRNILPSGDLTDLTEIRKIPLTGKTIFREKQAQFKAQNIQRGLTTKTTGGSTGAPVTVLKTKNALAQELAGAWRGFGWAGVGIGDKQARFWGVPHDKKTKLRAYLIDFICNRYRCSAFEFGDKDLAKYHKVLQRFKPQYFYGYVSMITEYAEFLIKNNLKTPCDLKCIITTSEVLSDIKRDLIEKVFRCKVFDEYGCGEIGTIAHECEEGNLHVNDENIIVEVLDENLNPVNKGEFGEIVVTELNNLAMPLIRYRIADYGCLANKPCKCGRKLNIIEEIKGREYDFLINSNGDKFHGEFFLYIIEDLKKAGATLNGVQFVQRSLHDLDVRVITGTGFKKEHKRTIVNRLRNGFDPDIKIIIKEEKYIERENSGKMRVVKRMFN